jgi:hypothetical protein
MSNVTRREQAATEMMTATMSGNYEPHTLEYAHLWRCDGCGLVWQKRWHAETCEGRGHKTSFQQGPYGVQRVENGKAVGTLTYYTRQAVRREKVEVMA